MAVLAHPIEAHYSCTSVRGWPKLYVEVWGQTNEDANVEIGARQRRPRRARMRTRVRRAALAPARGRGRLRACGGDGPHTLRSRQRHVLPSFLPRPVRGRVPDVGARGVTGRPRHECAPRRPGRWGLAHARRPLQAPSSATGWSWTSLGWLSLASRGPALPPPPPAPLWPPLAWWCAASTSWGCASRRSPPPRGPPPPPPRRAQRWRPHSGRPWTREAAALRGSPWRRWSPTRVPASAELARRRGGPTDDTRALQGWAGIAKRLRAV